MSPQAAEWPVPAGTAFDRPGADLARFPLNRDHFDRWANFDLRVNRESQIAPPVAVQEPTSTPLGIDLLGPIHEDRSWQARAQGGYDLSCFSLDMENMQATCPQGKTSVRFMQTKRRSGKPKFQFHFSEKDCLVCQARSLCTRSKRAGRQLTVLPPAEYQALQAARERQKGEPFKELYQLRAGIEGTISQAVRALSVRRAR